MERRNQVLLIAEEVTRNDMDSIRDSDRRVAGRHAEPRRRHLDPSRAGHCGDRADRQSDDGQKEHGLSASGIRASGVEHDSQ